MHINRGFFDIFLLYHFIHTDTHAKHTHIYKIYDLENVKVMLFLPRDI